MRRGSGKNQLMVLRILDKPSPNKDYWWSISMLMEEFKILQRDSSSQTRISKSGLSNVLISLYDQKLVKKEKRIFTPTPKEGIGQLNRWCYYYYRL